jgi:hypothetical protein
MALDFGVKNPIYKDALKNIKKIELSETHWDEVATLFEEESIKASQAIENQRVNHDLMHRCFSL